MGRQNSGASPWTSQAEAGCAFEAETKATWSSPSWRSLKPNNLPASSSTLSPTYITIQYRNHVSSKLFYRTNSQFLTGAGLSNREILLGITGKDFTIIAASKAAMRGPTILKTTDDKTRALNKHTLMAYSGESGDTGMMDCSWF